MYTKKPFFPKKSLIVGYFLYLCIGLFMFFTVECSTPTIVSPEFNDKPIDLCTVKIIGNGEKLVFITTNYCIELKDEPDNIIDTMYSQIHMSMLPVIYVARIMMCSGDGLYFIERRDTLTVTELKDIVWEINNK